jgi:hypothetical protein
MELETGAKCVLDAIRQKEVGDTFVIPVNTHMKVLGDTLKILNYQKAEHFTILDSLLCLACRVVTEKSQESCWETYCMVVCMLCAHAHAHPEWNINTQVSWHLAGLWDIYQHYPGQCQLDRSMLTTALLDSMMLGPYENSKIDRSLERCITSAITIGFILIQCDFKHPKNKEELLTFLGMDTLQPGLFPGIKVPKITVMDQVFYASTISDHIFEHFQPWLIQGIVHKNLVSLSLSSKPVINVIRNTQLLTKYNKQILCKYFNRPNKL